MRIRIGQWKSTTILLQKQGTSDISLRYGLISLNKYVFLDKIRLVLRT